MNSTILRITPGFSEVFIPSVAEIRTTLFNFYHKKYEKFLYHELIEACVKEDMEINIDTDEVQPIEIKTRERYQSELWYSVSSGVSPTSNCWVCCHIDIAKSSKIKKQVFNLSYILWIDT